MLSFKASPKLTGAQECAGVDRGLEGGYLRKKKRKVSATLFRTYVGRILHFGRGIGHYECYTGNERGRESTTGRQE